MNGKNGSREKEAHRATDILVSLSVGLVAGAASALLLAPASGRDTRKKIGRAANRISERANRLMHRTEKDLKAKAARVERSVADAGTPAARHVNLD